MHPDTPCQKFVSRIGRVSIQLLTTPGKVAYVFFRNFVSAYFYHLTSKRIH